MALLAGCAYAQSGGAQPTTSSPPFTVLNAVFGILQDDRFIPTSQVPNAPLQRYGWVIRVKTDRKTIHWREELQAPVPPKYWAYNTDQAGFKVSTDGLVAVAERTVPAGDGAIFHSWRVAPHDPSGPYEIRVYIEGRLAKTFQFQLK